MQEAKRFDGIDAAWKKIMAETSRNPVVLEACGAEGRQAQLQALSEQLEACQKSLSEYIELKRCAFTRCVVFLRAQQDVRCSCPPRMRVRPQRGGLPVHAAAGWDAISMPLKLI